MNIGSTYERGMGNGEREKGNGEWETGNGDRETGDGEEKNVFKTGTFSVQDIDVADYRPTRTGSVNYKNYSSAYLGTAAIGLVCRRTLCTV